MCSRNDKGGSIYFNPNGEFVENRVCSEKAIITTDVEGIFSYSYVSKKQNKMIDSSIVKTGEGSNEGRGSIRMQKGIININSVNISQSSTYRHSILIIHDANTNSDILFSSFCNDNQTDSGSPSSYISGIQSTNTMNIKSCNFNDISGGYTLLYSDRITTTLTSCNFIDISTTRATFYQVISGTTTIDQCYFNINPGTTGTVKFLKTLDQKINLILSHLSTYKCDAEFPKIFKPKNIVTSFISASPNTCFLFEVFINTTCIE